MDADWFERFFSHDMRDEAALRQLLASVPDERWSRFRDEATAHIHAELAELHQHGLPAGGPEDMEYGTLEVVTPLMARRREPLLLRRRLLGEENRRRLTPRESQ